MGKTKSNVFQTLFRRLNELWDEKRFVDKQPDQISFLSRLVYFVVLVLKRFLENRNFVRASSLAYTTLLAMVPLLAVGLSVTTSLLRDKQEGEIEKMVVKGIELVAPMLNISP